MAPQNAQHRHPLRSARRPALSAMLLVLLALLGPARVSHAQVEPVEPRWMTVTRDAPMRCGELTTFYKVADLKQGTVVRVDAISTRWARLIYPEDQFAFVAVGDADDVTENDLTLSPSARVRAPNAISGLSGSWRSLYLGEIPTDQRLSIVGTAEARDGQVIGYQIEPPKPPIAPHPPYGYAELSALRAATAGEVEAHLASLQTTDAPEVDPAGAPSAESQNSGEPDPTTPTGVPETPPAAQAESAPDDSAPDRPDSSGLASSGPGSSDPGTANPDTPPHAQDQPASEPDVSLIQDMVMPGTEPQPASVPQDAEPADDPAAADPEADTEPQPEAGQPEAVRAPAAEQPEPVTDPVPARTWLNWRELETTLARVRRAGGAVLEDALEELIAEYERSRVHLSGEGVRRAIDTRLNWLNARKATRDAKRAIAATARQADKLRNDAGSQRREWETTRSYDIVGRLVTSAVYDGTRLPRMYRVQAVDTEGLNRTIGYIKPTQRFELDPMLGRVVGVIGEAALDTALRLRVITPVRVVPLQPASGG